MLASMNLLEEFGRLSLGLPLMRGDGRPPGSHTNVSVGEYRLKDILVLQNGHVVRAGPKAAEIADIEYYA